MAAEIRKWIDEFESVSGAKVGTFTTSVKHKQRWWNRLFQSPHTTVSYEPDFSGMGKLYSFLASRLADVGGVEEDPDIVTIRTGPNDTMKVRITGTRGMHLTYKQAFGLEMQGLCPTADVVRADRGKLSEILTQLESEGKIT